MKKTLTLTNLLKVSTVAFTAMLVGCSAMVDDPTTAVDPSLDPILESGRYYCQDETGMRWPALDFRRCLANPPQKFAPPWPEPEPQIETSEGAPIYVLTYTVIDSERVSLHGDLKADYEHVEVYRSRRSALERIQQFKSWNALKSAYVDKRGNFRLYKTESEFEVIR